MSPLVEVQLVAGRELRKAFRSVKGIFLAAMTVAGGAGLSMLFAWIDRMKREQLPSTEDAHLLQQQLFERMYDADIGRSLADAPYALWMMLMVTLALAPLLVALLGFDAISGDLQHRTVRYWSIRARRASYVVGKFAGLWLSVLLVMAVMSAIVWGAIIAVGHQPVGPVLTWGLRFFGVFAPISAAWCGVATLVASQFRSPMLALLAVCAATFALWVVRVVAGVERIDALAYVYPNAYDRWLVSPRPGDLAIGLAGTLLIAVLTTTAAALAFSRRDV